MNKSFKDLMQPGKKNIGTILQVPSEELAEMLGHAGLELIILDMEHCPMTPPKIVSMVRACESVGALPFVRVPDVTDEDAIKKSLDAGACGILVPNIENADQARKAVEYGKFAPVGKRGACPFVRANWFSGEDCGAYYEKANRETTLMLLVEGPEGVKNLPEIVKVDGIDVIQIGAVDLSVALGIPGQTRHPKVIEAIRRAGELCAENGKILNYFIDNAEDAEAAKDWPGIGVFLLPIPEQVIHAHYAKLVKEVKPFC